jgi:hypothetical protein
MTGDYVIRRDVRALIRAAFACPLAPPNLLLPRVPPPARARAYPTVTADSRTSRGLPALIHPIKFNFERPARFGSRVLVPSWGDRSVKWDRLMPKAGGIMAPKTPTGGVSSLTAVKFNDRALRSPPAPALQPSPPSSLVRDRQRCESMMHRQPMDTW